MSAASFLWEMAQENNNQEQEASDEDYQTDRYEQERFNDTYSEDFTDVYDKGDRFTDEYHENFTD